MKNKVELSVIVPCYNTEKFIRKCVESILNQTYKNLEIILVDDCSTDKTYNILKQYAKDYVNIQIIKNEKNSGAGYSRNSALKVANGKYISYIDSDDYIDSDYYEEMIKTVKQNKADIAVCDIFIRYDGEGFDTRSCACNGKCDIITLIDNGLAASPCNKIFKKELIEKYPFPEGIMNEDVATVLSCIINSKKVAYNNVTYYNYLQHHASVQNARLSEKRFDIFKALDILEPRIKKSKKFKEYWNIIIFQQIIMLFFYVIPKEKDKNTRTEFLKKFNFYSSKYDLRKNPYYWHFIDEQGKKHKLYYKLLLKLNCLGFSNFASALISFYQKYQEKRNVSVIYGNLGMDDLIVEAKNQSRLPKSKTSISVVIPNYNYEQFLYERLYSILYQKVKINEIIILDDCSKDNSRDLIDLIAKQLLPYINIKKIYNKENSGSAFKQWKKGFELAKSDYVWIAEADDYCDENFLLNVIKPFKKNKKVVISYSDTAFIDKNGKIILKTIKPEIDILRSKHWDKNYINLGSKEIKDYSYLNCTIANVSSVVFKKADYDEFFKISGEFKQAGDWVFYNNVMNEGYIAFYNKPLNYYRVHGNNVTSTTKKQAHFDEIKRVHDYFDKKLGFSELQKSRINGRYEFLRKVWKVE